MIEAGIEVEQTNSVLLQPVSVEAVSLTPVLLNPADMPLRINLHNKKSGRVVLMGYKAAAMLAEKYPNEFEIFLLLSCAVFMVSDYPGIDEHTKLLLLKWFSGVNMLVWGLSKLFGLEETTSS